MLGSSLPPLRLVLRSLVLVGVLGLSGVACFVMPDDSRLQRGPRASVDLSGRASGFCEAADERRSSTSRPAAHAPLDDDDDDDDDAGAAATAGHDLSAAPREPPEVDASASDVGALLPPPWSPPIARSCTREADISSPARLARNILLFLGDGMGPGQVEAARALDLGPLYLDTLEARGSLNTDSLSSDAASPPIATDSAASATGFATGVRTSNGRLAIDIEGNRLQSVLDLAQAEGKAVGLVTTSYLYDASPMAFAVHSTDRFASGEIIEELWQRTPIDVLMGGGAGLLGDGLPALRTRVEALGYTLLLNSLELAVAPLRPGDKLLGLFRPSTSPASAGFPTTPVCARDASASDPSLPDMTARALELLAGDPEGFFLFVENENTDSYGHMGGSDAETVALAATALPREVRYLDDALGVALEWVAQHSSFEETLIVVTADHDTGGLHPGEHGFVDATLVHGGHTRTPVDIYAQGPGAQAVTDMCRLSELYSLLSGRVR